MLDVKTVQKRTGQGLKEMNISRKPCINSKSFDVEDFSYRCSRTPAAGLIASLAHQEPALKFHHQ